jgi:hypothetical protein
MSTMVSPMLRLFREGVQEYQPDTQELACETGDPQVSYENLERILAAGLTIRDILLRPTGTLFLFSTGEQFYAPGLRLGTDGPATEGLARIAAKAKFGSFGRLLRHLRAIEPDYCGPLYPLVPEKATVGDGLGNGLG